MRVATREIATKFGKYVMYHETVILDITYGRFEGVVLDSGGWRAQTTKKRMNQFLPWGLYVYQKNFVWYVGQHLGRGIHKKVGVFFDGMQITPKGEILNA